MATTWIKRFENRSKNPIALFNLEHTNNRGHGVTVSPGDSIQVDMAIPWPLVPPFPLDFANKHLEIKVNGATRYCIWQSAHIDGDYIRFSTDGQWHDIGDHVHGYAATATNFFEAIGGLFSNAEDPFARILLYERAIVVLDSHFECVPISPKPVEPAITTIKRIENRSSKTVRLRGALTDVVVAAGANQPVEAIVPWEIPGLQPLEVQFNGKTRFWIWQADHPTDGDYVRSSTNGWSATATRIKGVAVTGRSPADIVFTGDRTLVVTDTQVELFANPLVLDGLMDLVQPLLHRAQIQTQNPMTQIPSVSKKSATAFSIPGLSSDAYKNRQPNVPSNARFLYNDSGKRYEFRIDATGKVIATAPDGTTTTLNKTRSYNELRVGKDVVTPAFDLIAANGGRVFAKAAGADDFYWTTMDENFVHLPPGATNEITVPSTYFKLDPQFSQGNGDGLLVPVANIDTSHLATERLPTFRRVLEHHLTDLMIARVDPGYWQQLDFRPPQNMLMASLRELIQQLGPLAIGIVGLATGTGLLMMLAQEIFVVAQSLITAYLTTKPFSSDPPAWVAKHSPVTYVRDDGKIITPLVVKYEKVLDIGVGHVHLHQQYQQVVGGEMQAQFIDWLTYVYRFFNGGVWDADGYVDGTSNFYALVKYAPPPPPLHPDDPPPPEYGILFQDEQAYFSQRWRIVGPEDVEGLMFSIARDLKRPEYEWQEKRFWCPFWARHINEDSRMAVSAQVLLVTGKEKDTNHWRIYSINASWGTLDRSWRWRDFPPGINVSNDDAKVTDETIPTAASSADCVYPQTIRLRDDMTLHVKGCGRAGGNSVLGHWYQRYLPADNKPFPVALPENQMPPVGYPHKWKFVPRDVFKLADSFSHFGVYDQVNARLRYYDVTPLANFDAAQLETLITAEESWTKEPWKFNPWVDDTRQLYISQWKFKWDDPNHPGAAPMDHPSLFNPDTRLRIVKRGNRWIAMMWDKRDDDLVEFERLPRRVTLKRTNPAGGTPIQVQVTLSGHHRLLDPPMVRDAYFWWEPDGKAGVGFVTQKPGLDFMHQNVSRVRMAVLEPKADNPTKVDRVTSLFDKTTEGVFSNNPDTNAYEFRWMPSVAERNLLQAYCTEDAERRRGVSIWFENIVGNVAPPEQIRWGQSPVMNATATPSNVPLGVPTQMTVSVKDARTGETPMDGATARKGIVKIDGQVVGETDKAFTFTFNSRLETPRGQTEPETVYPTVTVEMPVYVPGAVPLSFYTPVLQVTMEPSLVPNGPTSQVVVRAEDANTHAPIAGRVLLNSVDVAATNVPFSYPFSVGVLGFVVANGYPIKRIPFGLYTLQMVVSVLNSSIPTGRPVQVTVRAIDSRSGAPVNGRVKLDGIDVGATNTPFTYTFGLTPPTGVVSVQFYGDVAIQWPPLTVSTLWVDITPFPITMNQPVTATVSAVDSVTGELIAGRVKVGIAEVGVTNTPFTATFRTTRNAEGEILYPYCRVIAPGYNDTEFSLGVG